MLILPRKVWTLLTTQERWHLAGLAGMVVLMGLAQVVGVGSIAPFVSVLVNPESAQTNPWLHRAFEGFRFESTDTFLLVLALAFLVALVVANGFLALTHWVLIRFGWALQRRLSRRLLEAYLALPYASLLDRNSADTGKNVLSEAERLTAGVMLPLLRITAFSVAGLFLLGFLFWANAALTFVVIAVLGGGYGVVYLSVRRTLARVGERRMQANTDRYKAVNEAFGGLKEIKVLGREAAMLGQYDGPAQRLAGAMSTLAVIVQIPRYALEVLAAGLVVLMALLLVRPAGGAIEGVAPLLAVYALAAQRLLPFLQQVYVNGSEIRSNLVVLDTIYDDMVQMLRPRRPAFIAADAATRLPFHRELRLEGVSFWYSRGESPAVEDVTVSIPHRAFVAFVGATGAGKTTLVDIILGLLRPGEGTLTVDGTPLDETVIRAWQNNLGYVPQDIYLADDSIAANIAFGIPPEDRRQDAIEAAARIANIHDFIVDELPERYDTVVGERGVRLSGGERQRIGIARALYHDPEVVVLDEATSNLDQATERAVHKAIAQAAAAKTVILIAHRLSTTRDCDALYLLDHGRLVAQGSYETLLLSSDRFRKMAAAR